GTIKGQVVWGENMVAMPKAIAAVDNHQDKAACQAKGPTVAEDWVVNPKNKGIRWTFVWLAPEAGQQLPIHPELEKIKVKQVEIDQPCCTFEPHGLAIREGQEILVKNSAPMPHNVKWAGLPLTNPGGNVILPSKGSHLIQNLKSDRIPVKVECNIHPWMSAWVWVFNHPYFAVTDA